MSGLLARLPRSFNLLGIAFLLLIAAVALGLHRSLDRTIAALLWQDVPCWGRSISERVSVVFAAELSLLYALALAGLCLRARKPFAGFWIVFLLMAGVGVEITFKYYFSQPAPSSFFETLGRAACGPTGPAYPFTVVSTPSTLPSGYSIRAAYFCLLLAAVVGGRWPGLRRPMVIGLGALAVVLAATRVTVGWHWPTDVAAGVLLGALAAGLATAGADGFQWLRARGAPRARGGASGGPSGRRASGTRPSTRQRRR